MSLSRYSRQYLLPEIGVEGQRHLGSSSVLLIGAGGLGSPVALYLAAAGVGHLTIIDNDLVDASNLQRQILFKTSDSHSPKVLAAQRELMALNPDLHLKIIQARFNASNALELVQAHDLVIDGSDNFSTKFITNDAAFKAGRPLVTASVQGFEGQVALFVPGDRAQSERSGPCYRCLLPNPPKAKIQNCAEAGVLGSVVGTLGTLQATLALQSLLSKNTPSHPLNPESGMLTHLDFKGPWSFSRMQIPPRKACITCSQLPERIVIGAGLEDPINNSPACVSRQRQTDREANNRWPNSLPGDLDGSSDASDEMLSEMECKQLLGQLQSDPDHLLLVDVRTTREWNTGHLKGAIHLPLALLERATDLQELPPSLLEVESRKKPWVIYCHAGVRSVAACYLLKSLGIQSVTNLAGGLLAWEACNPPQTLMASPAGSGRESNSQQSPNPAWNASAKPHSTDCC